MKKTLIALSLVAGLAVCSMTFAKEHTITVSSTAVCLAQDTNGYSTPATAFACCGTSVNGQRSVQWSPMTTTACPDQEKQVAACSFKSKTVDNSAVKVGSSCLFS